VSSSDGGTVKHRYGMPGGYQVRLFAGAGTLGFDSARQQVKVPDVFGELPPSALITRRSEVYDPISGNLALNLTCESDDPTATARWEFSDDDTTSPSEGRDIVHTFKPGRYRVHCLVQSASGLWGHDWHAVHTVPLISLPAPECRLAFSQPSGEAPLTTAHLAEVNNDLLGLQVSLVADGRAVDLGTSLSYESGLHPVKLTVGSSLTQLQCRDYGGVFAWVKPKFTTEPPACASALKYEPGGVGTEPINLVLDGSPGVRLEQNPYTVRWTPEALEGARVRFKLQARNHFGEDVQQGDVNVTCEQGLDFHTSGCGCSTGFGPALALLAACGLRRRKR